MLKLTHKCPVCGDWFTSEEFDLHPALHSPEVEAAYHARIDAEYFARF